MRDSILITGSATGIGRETALYLAERGFQVYATMRDLSKADALYALAQDRHVQIKVLSLDVMDEASIREAVQTIVTESGGIYGVINNAGHGLRGYFEDYTNEEIQQVFEVNVFGAMAVTKAVLPYMRQAGRGRILLISSIGGRIGSLGVSAYCSTKFALEGFGESLFQEIAPLGLKVVLIEPGIVATDIWKDNRGVAKGAQDPNGLYYTWFSQAESEANRLVQTSTMTLTDVASVMHRALTVKRPKLRYVVGRKARLAVALRGMLPGELFERLYFGTVMRRVTGGKAPSAKHSESSNLG